MDLGHTIQLSEKSQGFLPIPSKLKKELLISSHAVVRVEAFYVKKKYLKHFLPDKLSNQTVTGSLLTSFSGQKTKEEPELGRGGH